MEANRIVARRAIEEVWNRHSLDAVDVLYAANHVAHEVWPCAAASREGVRRIVSQTAALAPAARLRIDLMMAEGDRVAVRYTAHNGHADTAPRGATGALHVRIVRGQIRESWGVARMAERLQRVAGTAH